MPNLYTQPNECCGCRACANVCPKNAIAFLPDEFGFMYPSVDDNLCVNCGACMKVCDFQKDIPREPTVKISYASVNKDDDVLRRSSSGGVFSAAANAVLSQGGVVAGCVLDEQLKPMHICSDEPEDIERMQGSKYVQSNIGYCYREVRTHLKTGRAVLFTGTPCQGAALRAFLGREYDKLTIMDFVCHGVSSDRVFTDYIHYLEKKHNKKIIDFHFRSKAKGWPKIVHTMDYVGVNGKKKHKLIGAHEEFFSPYFYKGKLFRLSCYECPYANTSRQADITMGDFWGYEKADLPFENVDKGLSICLINTEKGEAFLDVLSKELQMTEIPIACVVEGNKNLRHPSVMATDRQEIMNNYAKHGVEYVAKNYIKNNFTAHIKSRIMKYIPIAFSKCLHR